MTYGSEFALESNTIPKVIKEAENKKKELLDIHCPFFGYFQKEHKTAREN